MGHVLVKVFAIPDEFVSSDQLYGGIGNDTLDAGAGNDRLEGEDGAYILEVFAGDDYILGGNGNEK